MAIEKRNTQHITEIEDLPRKPEAVYTGEGHIKPSFLLKFAIESLGLDAKRIEDTGSRKRLSPEEKRQIESLRQRVEVLKSSVPKTGMDNKQFIEMRIHVMRCPECRQETGKIRGDLPANSLPF